MLWLLNLITEIEPTQCRYLLFYLSISTAYENGFRRKLQNQVSDFRSNTEEKRRLYNDLLTKDKKGVGEIAENNKKIVKLMVSEELKTTIAIYHST